MLRLEANCRHLVHDRDRGGDAEQVDGVARPFLGTQGHDLTLVLAGQYRHLHRGRFVVSQIGIDHYGVVGPIFEHAPTIRAGGLENGTGV